MRISDWSSDVCSSDLEAHAYSAQLMHLLQTAVATDSYSVYLQFARGVADLPPVYLRDLMEFNYPAQGVPLDSVEAITEIRKRFVTPGMSLGALSPEAHETRSEEHTSELQSLMRISYAVFCLKKKN